MIKTALTEWTPLEWAALCLGRELYLGTELFGASGNCITNSSAFLPVSILFTIVTALTNS